MSLKLMREVAVEMILMESRLEEVKVSAIKHVTTLFLSELEFYTEEHLRPKAPRLNHALIEEIQKKYADQQVDDDESDDEEADSQDDEAQDRHSFNEDDQKGDVEVINFAE